MDARAAAPWGPARPRADVEQGHPAGRHLTKTRASRPRHLAGGRATCVRKPGEGRCARRDDVGGGGQTPPMQPDGGRGGAPATLYPDFECFEPPAARPVAGCPPLPPPSSRMPRRRVANRQERAHEGIPQGPSAGPRGSHGAGRTLAQAAGIVPAGIPRVDSGGGRAGGAARRGSGEAPPRGWSSPRGSPALQVSGSNFTDTELLVAAMVVAEFHAHALRTGGVAPPYRRCSAVPDLGRGLGGRP